LLEGCRSRSRFASSSHGSSSGGLFRLADISHCLTSFEMRRAVAEAESVEAAPGALRYRQTFFDVNDLAAPLAPQIAGVSALIASFCGHILFLHDCGIAASADIICPSSLRQFDFRFI